MKLGDGKWVEKQTGERTVRTRKTEVTKGQGWEQGEEEERRDKQRNRDGGTMIYVLLFLHTVTSCQMTFHLRRQFPYDRS